MHEQKQEQKAQKKTSQKLYTNPMRNTASNFMPQRKNNSVSPMPLEAG